MELHSKQISPNNGILLNGVLRPTLLNIHFSFCSFRNLDFLVPHILHFANRIFLTFLLFKTLYLFTL